MKDDNYNAREMKEIDLSEKPKESNQDSKNIFEKNTKLKGHTFFTENVRKNTRWIGFLLLTAITFFLLGSSWIQDKENIELEEENLADFSFYERAWKELDERHISPYEEEESPTDQEKVWWSIRGLASSYGDPYTDFFPPVENEVFREDVDREFYGVGMEVDKIDGFFTVVSPLPGTPSAKAGIQPKDIILKIDGEDISDLQASESIERIRGPKGTEVILTIFREGKNEPFDIVVVRDLIKIPTVETQEVDGVSIVSVYSFGPETLKEFRDELITFVDKNTDKIIIDLRYNPGGYLGSSLSMASFFLDGDMFILEERAKNTRESQMHYSEGNLSVFGDDLKMVILVNEGSASASEIFAGILSDYKKAIVVGERTFGKGSVQEVVEFTEDTSLKMTVAKWFLPSGVSVSETGIIPDVEQELFLEEEEIYDISSDSQILRSIEVLHSDEFFDLRDNKKTEKEKQEVSEDKEIDVQE